MAPKVSDFKASLYTRLTALTKARFDKIKTQVEELSTQKELLTPAQLKSLTTLSNEIKKKKADFDANLQRALNLTDDEAITDEVLVDDQDSINDLYAHILGIIETLLPVEEPKTPSALSDVSMTAQVPSVSQVRLPKLDLQKFSGDLLTWTSFINLFDTTIHRNASLSAVMKFQYLLSVLIGEPLNLIKGLNLTTANYLIAYDLLRDRYHNTRRLQTLHLNQLLDLPQISSSSTKGLRLFVNQYTEHSQALKALSCDVGEHNPLLSALILRRMDSDLRKKLEASRSISSDDPSDHSLPEVKEIIKFLNTECSQTEDANIHSVPHAKSPAYVHPHARNKASVPKKAHFRSSDVSMITTHSNSAQTKSMPPPCFVCNQTGHKVYSCTVFRNKTPQERHQLVKRHKRCVSCLGSHELKECQSKATCLTCNKRHHSLLHFQSVLGNAANHPVHGDTTHDASDARHRSSENHSDSQVTHVSQDSPPSMSACYTVLLGTLLVQLKTPEGRSHVFRALLDSGSMTDLISERAAQLLGVRRTKSQTHISGLSQSMAKPKGQTHLIISTLSGLIIAPHQPMLILDKLTVDLPRVPLAPEVYNKTQRYILADPTFHLPGRIDVIIGGSLFPKILTNEQFSLGQHMPHVIGTHFGFVVLGTAPSAPSASTLHSTSLNVSLHSASDADLHSSLQRFWLQEEVPVPSNKTEEEELCDAHFATSHFRDETGRYTVRLPFKESNHSALGSSQPIAERRFHSLERKFNVQPHFSQLYHDFISEYRSLDHMSKVQNLDLTKPHYFLPHHGVLKENSSTTKLRTVFDASCKTSTGVSLNDVLLTGRKLQTNICDILLHFRSHNIVFCCDIRQMYRQIRVNPDDRKFQLILWRDHPEEILSTYQLNTVTYGMSTSPYLAIKTLHQLADDDGGNFPSAAHVLRTQTYVDDIISGADTEEAALELQEQLIRLLRQGGFELRKWVSNSTRLLQALPEGHRESPVFLQESKSPQFSILGLHWSPTTDCFTYSLNIPSDERPTKRSVLSIIAKIYDPCGFLSPCIMQAKCFMQLLWTTGLSWDEPLPPELADKWHSFVTDVQHIVHVSIPRAFLLSLSCAVELHGFSDASESGYSAVLYFRCQLSTGDVIIRPIMAKTRVAPLKRVTLPRLELCGAHLLAKLTTHCQSIFNETITPQTTFLWCDSTVVLTWLRTPPYRLKTYVSNRVSQIQGLVSPDSWRHISGNDNPADCASRGIYASQLKNHPLWWTGPPWLSLRQQDWPHMQFVPMDLSSSEELKKTPLVVLAAVPQKDWDILTKFSSWDNLQRIFALVLRFVHNCRSANRLKGHLSPSEIFTAKLKIFGLVQKSAFADDISSLRSERPCSTRLQRLKPFLDTQDILRVGGRLSRSSLSPDIRHPVLLPKKHHVVNLIVDHYHRANLHAGPQLTQSLLSQSVWILCARSTIRSRIFQCRTCFRNKPRNQPPLMGDLPPSRVTPARPFWSTGTDFCGPFNTKVLNLRTIRHTKVYICVFVCMVTKAVHLEVVTDLTTDAFIAALTRFVSRRGLCVQLFSDCGTNYVGADNVLQKIIKETLFSTDSQKKLLHFTTPRGIEFKFNPPAAPHQGGLWESAVKSAKHHLRRVMGDTVLTLPEFMTLITQIEAMLNSRPLIPLSSDPADLSALTPGHFLIGAPLASVPEPDLFDVPNNRLRHWQLVQAFHQRIWKRWQLEYLNTLQQRYKWTQSRENINVGDLVLVHQNSPPLSWPLARVTAVHPGTDGVVRVVDLRTPNGHLTRPVVKVFPLPTE